MQSTLPMFGSFAAKKISGKVKAPIAWRIQNALHLNYIRGWLAFHIVRHIARWFGLATMIATLEIRKFDAALHQWVDYGVVSYRVVTDAGVAAMADDFTDASAEITNFKYHGCGTGTGAEAVGDTTLTECTTALNPDSTRATGTNTNPTAPVYRSVGTLTFDADTAVTEHGIFSQAATGGGTLWDRSKFTAINVVGASGDSIQFTYSLTLTSGG